MLFKARQHGDIPPHDNRKPLIHRQAVNYKAVDRELGVPHVSPRRVYNASVADPRPAVKHDIRKDEKKDASPRRLPIYLEDDSADRREIDKRDDHYGVGGHYHDDRGHDHERVERPDSRQRYHDEKRHERYESDDYEARIREGRDKIYRDVGHHERGRSRERVDRHSDRRHRSHDRTEHERIERRLSPLGVRMSRSLSPPQLRQAVSPDEIIEEQRRLLDDLKQVPCM